MASSADVVVWCHCSRNLWFAFEPGLSNFVETAFLAGSSMVDISNLSPKFTSHTIDLVQQRLYSHSHWDDNAVERRVCHQGSLYADNKWWEFEGDNIASPWTPYDMDSSQQIEDKSKTKKKFDLTTALPFTYTIDIRKKIQTNVQTLKQRKIRCRQLSPPGYASYSPQGATPTPSLSSQVQGATGTTRKKRIVSSNLSVTKTRSRSKSKSKASAFKVELPKVSQISIQDDDRFKTDNCSQFLSKFTKPVVWPDGDTESSTEDCAICVESLSEESGYGEGRERACDVVELSDCQHKFHRLCIEEMYKSRDKDGFLECPTCKRIHGEKHGNCPAGRMEWTLRRDMSLAGYEGLHTLQVTYIIDRGIQGKGHPNPGKPFNARGFPRVAYIPDCDKGRTVLRLLMAAFDRRLMFTIGTSSTTGESDVVIWNDIHHKTEPSGNRGGHGYPDPAYLDNVLLELCVQGVTE